jgi:hypothetical protein
MSILSLAGRYPEVSRRRKKRGYLTNPAGTQDAVKW